MLVVVVVVVVDMGHKQAVGKQAVDKEVADKSMVDMMAVVGATTEFDNADVDVLAFPNNPRYVSFWTKTMSIGRRFINQQ